MRVNRAQQRRQRRTWERENENAFPSARERVSAGFAGQRSLLLLLEKEEEVVAQLGLQRTLGM